VSFVVKFGTGMGIKNCLLRFDTLDTGTHIFVEHETNDGKVEERRFDSLKSYILGAKVLILTRGRRKDSLDW